MHDTKSESFPQQQQARNREVHPQHWDEMQGWRLQEQYMQEGMAKDERQGSTKQRKTRRHFRRCEV